MTRAPVKSSNIQSVGYDAATRALEIEFKSGGVYRYHGVTLDEYHALVNSASLGSHFHHHIRSRYQSERMDTPAPKGGA